MCYEAQKMVWRQKMPKTIKNRSGAKQLLGALAYFSRPKSGIAFVSNKTLSEYTEMDRKTVISLSRSLVDHGFLIDTGKRAGRTSQVIIYQLVVTNQDLYTKSPKYGMLEEYQNWDSSPEEESQVRDYLEEEESQVRDTLDNERVPNFLHKSSELPAKEYQVRDTEQVFNKDIKHTLSFERVCEAYPRKESFAKAEKIFLALKPGDDLVTKMLNAIATQRTSLNWTEQGGRFIPKLAKWLVGQCWNDQLRYPDSTQAEEPKSPEITPEWAEHFATYQDWSDWTGYNASLQNLLELNEKDPSPTREIVINDTREKMARLRKPQLKLVGSA